MQDAENKCGRFPDFVLLLPTVPSWHGRGGGGSHVTYLEKEVSVLRASMAPWVACRTSFRFRSWRGKTTFSTTDTFLPVITYSTSKTKIREIRCYIQKIKTNRTKGKKKNAQTKDKRIARYFIIFVKKKKPSMSKISVPDLPADP